VHTHLHGLSAIDSSQAFNFITMISFSFFSSFHCAFMCGPLVTAVLGPDAHPKKIELWIYNFARIVVYSTVGLLAGGASASLSIVAPETTNGVAVIIGGSMLGLGLARLVGLGRYLKFKGIGQGLFGTPMKIIGVSKYKGALLGAGTIFLPCMTLTPAILLAAGSGSATLGAAGMLGFGLGTLPVMLAGPSVIRGAVNTVPKGLATAIASIFLMLAGAVTVLRAFH
jgi:sulfite exporter TauE/SafE